MLERMRMYVDANDELLTRLRAEQRRVRTDNTRLADVDRECAELRERLGRLHRATLASNKWSTIVFPAT